jgi:hypothetical protein
MLIVTVNAIVGAVCCIFALNALKRGWPFLCIGWTALQSNARQPDARTNIYRRQAIAEGGRFFLGGVMWLVAGVSSGIIGLIFSWGALRMLYGIG